MTLFAMASDRKIRSTGLAYNWEGVRRRSNWRSFCFKAWIGQMVRRLPQPILLSGGTTIEWIKRYAPPPRRMDRECTQWIRSHWRLYHYTQICRTKRIGSTCRYGVTWQQWPLGFERFGFLQPRHYLEQFHDIHKDLKITPCLKKEFVLIRNARLWLPGDQRMGPWRTELSPTQSYYWKVDLRQSIAIHWSNSHEALWDAECLTFMRLLAMWIPTPGMSLSITRCSSKMKRNMATIFSLAWCRAIEDVLLFQPIRIRRFAARNLPER